MAATKDERFDKIRNEKIKFPSRAKWTDKERKLCDFIEKLLHKDAN